MFSAGMVSSEGSLVIFGNGYGGSPSGAIVRVCDERHRSKYRQTQLRRRVELTKIEQSSDEIVCAVTLQEADEHKQRVGQVKGSLPRVHFTNSNKERCRYEVEGEFSMETAVEAGGCHKREGYWNFEPSGIGHKSGLKAFINIYCEGPVTIDLQKQRGGGMGGEDGLRQQVAGRVFDRYCDESTWRELVREGVEKYGLNRAVAETVVNMEIEAHGAINETLLIEELDALLHRFTDRDKKLDQKERDDALQYVCKARSGHSKGLKHQVADRYITEFCRTNRVKVKVGLFKWEIPV